MEDSEDVSAVNCSAAFVMLDVPEHTAIGVDLQLFLTGPLFKGIKLVPPGPHIVSYRSVAASGGSSTLQTTSCMFVYSYPGEIKCWRWNNEEESLDIIDAEQGEAMRLAAAVSTPELDRFLGPYNASSHFKQWYALSKYIYQRTIDQIRPVGGKINVLSEPFMVETGSTAEADLESQLKALRTTDLEQPSGSKMQIAHVSSSHGSGRCYYTSIPRLAKKEGMTPEELTAQNMDKSKMLDELLQKSFDNEERRLLGEFQFAFLAFLVGQSLEGFQQWRSIISLVLGCEEAVISGRVDFFSEFLQVLYSQLDAASGTPLQRKSEEVGLQQIIFTDKEMFTDAFLTRQFALWASFIEEEKQDVPTLTLQWTESIASLLKEKIGIDLPQTEEYDSDGPVIVDA